MKTFKVGQKVRWDGECDGLEGKGRIFEVARTSEDRRIRIIKLGEELFDGYGWEDEYLGRGYFWNVKGCDNDFTVAEEKSGCGFKVGDKVKIISKSIGASLKDSNVYNDKTSQEKGYWIITNIKGNGSGTNYNNYICVGRVRGEDRNGGDFFAPKDLARVTEKQDYCAIDSSTTKAMESLHEQLYRPQTYSTTNTFDQKQVEKTKNNTIMSVIKNIFKSEERKALEHFGVVNGDGKLTDTGRDEFVDFLYEKMNTEREAFVALLIEEYKKVTK